MVLPMDDGSKAYGLKQTYDTINASKGANINDLLSLLGESGRTMLDALARIDQKRNEMDAAYTKRRDLLRQEAAPVRRRLAEVALELKTIRNRVEFRPALERLAAAYKGFAESLQDHYKPAAVVAKNLDAVKTELTALQKRVAASL